MITDTLVLNAGTFLLASLTSLDNIILCLSACSSCCRSLLPSFGSLFFDFSGLCSRGKSSSKPLSAPSGISISFVDSSQAGCSIFFQNYYPNFLPPSVMGRKRPSSSPDAKFFKWLMQKELIAWFSKCSLTNSFSCIQFYANLLW